MPNAPGSPPGSDLPSAALHEMRELLTAISGYTGAARRLLESDTAEAKSQLTEILDKIAAQERRASRIVLRLRRLLPGDPPQQRVPGGED